MQCVILNIFITGSCIFPFLFSPSPLLLLNQVCPTAASVVNFVPLQCDCVRPYLAGRVRSGHGLYAGQRSILPTKQERQLDRIFPPCFAKFLTVSWRILANKVYQISLNSSFKIFIWIVLICYFIFGYKIIILKPCCWILNIDMRLKKYQNFQGWSLKIRDVASWKSGRTELLGSASLTWCWQAGGDGAARPGPLPPFII